jgi:hypothetical protein
MTLKELRMWHWKKVLSKRASAGFHETMYKTSPAGVAFHKHRARQDCASANFHINAVQTLNDLLPETTAEEDCSEVA